jgi:hypothetical protein
MRPMEHYAAGRPPASDPRPTQAASADTDEETRDIPHFESLRVPGLFSASALLPEWLRRRFRRTTPSH